MEKLESNNMILQIHIFNSADVIFSFDILNIHNNYLNIFAMKLKYHLNNCNNHILNEEKHFKSKISFKQLQYHILNKEKYFKSIETDFYLKPHKN